MPEYRTYHVAARQKGPLLAFFLAGLEAAGCKVLHRPEPDVAPYRVVFETPWGERIGVILYLFQATARVTANRPTDEGRLQLKYGSKTSSEEHELNEDRFGLYVTLLVGVDLERRLLVSVDPTIHNPTKLFISIFFKNADADQALQHGWWAWERTKRDHEEPIEVLVGCVQDRILDLVLFERAAAGLSQGHRHLLADRLGSEPIGPELSERQLAGDKKAHPLLAELSLDTESLLDVIENASRLKTAVRGWVAQRHLLTELEQLSGLTGCRELHEDGRPDFELVLPDNSVVRIECKNCLRRSGSDGRPRVDFQRTRHSKSDPCSRFYRPEEFQILAACLHPVTERWEFMFQRTDRLPSHATCPGRLSSRVVVDDGWHRQPGRILASFGWQG